MRSASRAIATTTSIVSYNGVGDFRYSTNEGSFYLNLSADDQNLGLPGHRRVQPRSA